MVYDGHVHIRPGEPTPELLLEKMATCGVSGAVLISLPPEDGDYSYRLHNLERWTDSIDNFIPFFWIDPIQTDAIKQVYKAIEAGVAGFKLICDRFYPSDKRCLAVCEMAANANKPVLFHSGILWDGKPSSEFCRPVYFEHMLNIKNLRFSLAHIGWPWCDEMIAVYGKFLNFKSRNPKSKLEMYIDMTPGTPANYREEVLRKLFRTGYDIERNIIFGTDCDANDYNNKWAGQWMALDDEIYSGLGLDKKVVSGIYNDNLEMFIRGSKKTRGYRNLTPASL